MRTMFACAMFLFSAVLFFAAPAGAAKFVLTAPQPAVKVGEETNVYIELAPAKGEKVMGGRLTLTVNPLYILLSPDQNKYASDGAFSKVEKFKADPISGTIVFNVQTDAPITKTKIFLRVPVKFMQAGISSISYSSSVYFEDLEPVSANAGYQRVAGVTGAVDPMLYSSLVGENGTLMESSVARDLEIARPATALAGPEIDMSGMDLGVALVETNDDADADVVMEFSRRTGSIGLRQWVRLDVMITKYPEYEAIAGASFKVKYDPQAMQFTDKVGQAASTVELNSVFKEAFVNRVDASKGEISVSIGVDPGAQSTPVPANVITLYFRTLRETGDTRVSLDDVLLMLSKSDAKLSKHDAAISVSAAERKCDSALPATLCKGTFKVSGDLKMSFANKNETLRDPVGAAGTGNAAAVTVKKYYLEQTWNMHMDGSFKNGVRLQGSLTDSPGSQQVVNLEMLAGDWKANFGNFNTSFAESKFVGFSASELTGLLLNYKYKNLSLRMLSAERKSSPIQTSIAGKDNIGPYLIARGIIPSSLRLFRDNKLLAPDEYSFDVARGEITFKKLVPTTETIIVMYQMTTTGLFSTGNIQAYRTDYTPKDGAFGIGGTFLSTLSPKSGSQVRLFSSEVFNAASAAASGSFEVVDDCKFFGSKKCISIKLAHPYMIKGTLLISNKVGARPLTYTENHTAQVFVGHRGWYEGRIFLEYGSFNPLNVSVEYSYYNPQFLSQPSIVSYSVDGKDSTYDSQSWPVDMFPGSEMLYLSDDTHSDISEGSDAIVCYKGESKNEVDSAYLCPGAYNPVEPNITYYLKELNNRTYVQLSQSAGAGKRLKVKYSTNPPDMPSSSEFQKTAWSVDTKFKVGKKINVSGEYAMANSDLSASFNTITEQLVVDVNTFENVDSGDALFNPLSCWWQHDAYSYGTSNRGILHCKLKGNKLQGTIQIQIQKCDMTFATSQECVTDANGNYLYTNNSGRIYDVLIPFNNVDREKGVVKMVETPDGWKTDAPYNLTTSSINREPMGFPIKGDKLYVTYTYDQALSKIVTGGAYYVNASFQNKAASVSVERRALSPLFDKSLSAFQDTTFTKLDVALTSFKRWGITFNQSESLKDTANEKKVITTSVFTPTRAFSIRYVPSYPAPCQAPCGPDKSLKITTFSVSRNDSGSRSVTETARTENQMKTLAGLFSLSFRNNKYTASFSSSNAATNQKSGTLTSSRSRNNGMDFNWNPSQKYKLSYTLTSALTSPTGSGSDSRKYKLSLKPISLFTLDTGFQRDNTKQSYTSSPNIRETMDYNLNFPKIRKITGLNIRFARDQTPGATIENPNQTRNDNLNMGFSMKLKKRLTFTPSYTRTVSFAQPSTWTLTRNKSWSLDYSRSVRKTGTFSTRFTTAKGRTISGIGGGSVTATKNDGLTANYSPSAKTTFTTDFTRTGGSGAPTRNVKVAYRKTLMSALIFSSDLSITRSFSLSPTKNIIKNMSFTWQLNQETAFALKYSRSDNRSQGVISGPRSNTTFSTDLTTRFR